MNKGEGTATKAQDEKVTVVQQSQSKKGSVVDRMEETETKEREELVKEINEQESMPTMSSPRGKESSMEISKEQKEGDNPIPVIREEGEDGEDKAPVTGGSQYCN